MGIKYLHYFEVKRLMSERFLSNIYKFIKFKYKLKNEERGTSLPVQWLKLCASTARGMGLLPGGGTKIPYATWHGQINK